MLRGFNLSRCIKVLLILSRVPLKKIEKITQKKRFSREIDFKDFE